MGASTRKALVLVAATLVVAALTALVFLIRAGGDPMDAATWPIQWELRSSDNGPLFQFLQDVVAGRPLDWSFSPQVFVFPELPISAIAFAVTGGSITGYYLVVAMVNNAMLFLVLYGLVRVLHPSGHVLRPAVAMLPLIVFPLMGTSWILSFHLAPTYYFGMYAALLAAPLFVLTRCRAGRIAIGAALALTAASNPLALLFAAPGTAAALLVHGIRHGWRATRRPGVEVGVMLAATLVLRLLFSPLQGTSPFTYVDPDVFATRLSQIGPYYAFQARDPAAAVILPLGALLAGVCLGAAIVAAVRYARGRSASLAAVYLGLIPLGGLAATFAVMITHYLYFWPVLILPFMLVLLAVPRVAVAPAVASGIVLVVVVALATGGVANLGTAGRFFGYRSVETSCLDEAVPGQVGYATFSDARRVSLPSATGVRLIQIEHDLRPSHWLTNRAYSTTEAGTFFYVNGHGDERAIETELLVQAFGEPDREVSCGDAQSLLVYDDPAKQARIAEFYGVES